MDLVQFIYAFVLTPTIFIWLKTVIFFNLGNDLGVVLDYEDRFVIDTFVTAIMLVIYAFTVIHSLTKTFEIKKKKDPLFDLFEHSEYFHLWLSHIVTYSGALILFLFLGIINIFFPMVFFVKSINLYAFVVVGIIFSMLFTFAVDIYKVEGKDKFARVIKLQTYLYTFFLLVIYLFERPKYLPQHSIFWFCAAFFVGCVLLSQVKFTKLRNRVMNTFHLVFMDSKTGK